MRLSANLLCIRTKARFISDFLQVSAKSPSKRDLEINMDRITLILRAYTCNELLTYVYHV